MRIKTQFIVTMLLFGIILVVLAASAIITHQKLEKASKQERLAANIAQGASELSYLTNDYLIYRESQQLSRWQSRFASFSNQVASLNVDKPEQQVLVRNIKANEQRLKQVFNSVASAVEGPSQDRSTTLDLAFLQVSWSRMAVQSQGLVSDASRLSQLLHQQREKFRETRTMLMYVMVGLFGLFLLVSYMLTYRRILKSIMTFRARTIVIGSGNLDFKIEQKKNDEIGDLSHAFDRMTSSLKEVTASKAELEREIAERKKAEEELRQQREWLRVTLSSIGDAVIASDREGRITFLNPVAVTLTGWQIEEAMGQPITSVFQIINERTRQSAEDLVARVLSEKRVVALANDTALVTRDGREVPIEDSAAPIKDATGNVTGVVLVFHDVTEKRRAQAALREAHERAVWLARFPEQNPNPIIRASADGTVLYCNPASERLHGWKCEFGQLLQNELLPLISRAMAEERDVEEDIELDGRSYIVLIVPFPKERYANVYGREITKRKRAEEALRESEERFRAVFESSSDCILVWDRQYNYLYANQAAIDHVGTTRDKVIGKNIRDGLRHVPDFMHLWMERVNRAFATGEPFRVEDAVPVGDRLVFSESQVSPIRDAAGKVFAVSVVYRDVTERKKAEEALRESEERLNRAQEIAHLGSWELDLVSNRLTWSDQVYRTFGLKPQEFGATYEAFLDAVHPDDRAAVDTAYSSSVREGRDTYEIEHRVVRKSTGEIRTIHERCEHIRDTSGRIIRSIGMVHDITERKRAEEALLQRTLELQHLTETLDQQVKERTEELKVANEQLMRQVNECQRIAMDLRKSETSLRHLSIELLSSQEKERKLVAGEIHDSIGSSLSAIKFKVENALTEVTDKNPEITTVLQSLIPIIRGAIDEARRIQMNLRPSILDDLGILPTTDWFCREFEKIYSTIHIKKLIDIHENEVPAHLRTVIFRVMQEALNNIAKHSKADLVHLSLQKTDDKIELAIQDNGQGFNLMELLSVEGSKRGLGLTSMRERTELSGGTFTFESIPEKGTIIKANWPI